MSDQYPPLTVLAGLGNPGSQYHLTRHNIGFMVIDAIAAAAQLTISKTKFNAQYGRGKIGNCQVMLVKPLKFMNCSGPPIRQLTDYFSIDRHNLIVIHDDIDLAFGRIKIKQKGGDGGHNGVKSIIQAFGGSDFVRVRVGVGRGADPNGRPTDVIGHVLGRFDQSETEALETLINIGRDAVVACLKNGATAAMNSFNSKRLVIAS